MAPTSRGLRTRRHLIERCAHVFDRNGFAASTLEEMVRATGYTRGAFYFHFDSKDAAAKAVVDAQGDRWAALLERVRATEPDPMRALLSYSFASVAVHGTDTVLRAASRLLAEGAVDAGVLPDTHHWWVGTVAGLLCEASEAGSLREDVGIDREQHLEAVATYLVHGWTGNLLPAGAGLLDLPTQLRVGWELTLAALCRAPEPLVPLRDLAADLADALRADPVGLLARFGVTGSEDG